MNSLWFCLVTGDQGEYHGSAAGLNLENNELQNVKVLGMDELQCVEIDSNAKIKVDLLVGDNMARGDIVTPLKYMEDYRLLPPGKYSSHLLHYDPPTNSEVGDVIVHFNGQIAAIIFHNEGIDDPLNDSDDIFGNAAAYEKHGSRKADAGFNSDSFQLMGNGKIKIIRMKAGAKIDQIRILTKCNGNGGGGGGVRGSQP